MSEEMTCTMCHCIVDEDEVTEFDDVCLCDDCRDEHTTTCDHCGEMIWASDSVCDDHMTLCQDCYDDHYCRCENCGQLVHDNDVYTLSMLMISRVNHVGYTCMIFQRNSSMPMFYTGCTTWTRQNSGCAAPTCRRKIISRSSRTGAV